MPGGDFFQLIINCRGKSPSECAEQISSVLWGNVEKHGPAESSGMNQGVTALSQTSSVLGKMMAITLNEL